MGVRPEACTEFVKGARHEGVSGKADSIEQGRFGDASGGKVVGRRIIEERQMGHRHHELHGTTPAPGNCPKDWWTQETYPELVTHPRRF